MSIECVRREASPPEVEIKVSGRFDFSMHRTFRDVWQKARGVDTCIIDMRETTYIDSSALGMLLLLREDYQRVVIRNCPSTVMKVFSIAKFETLFDFA